MKLSYELEDLLRHERLPYLSGTELSLDFYPSRTITVGDVRLEKVNPYVMGSRNLLGMVHVHSGRGMVLEGLTGEELEKVVDHEVFHVMQRPNNEDRTRQYTCTEEPRLHPMTCVRNY